MPMECEVHTMQAKIDLRWVRGTLEVPVLQQASQCENCGFVEWVDVPLVERQSC